MVVVAVPGDRHAVDQLHDEVGPAGFRGPGVEDAGDVDVVHHGQGLPLGLEAGDDLPAVHPRLDDLERDLAPDGPGLLGHVDRAHAAFADLLQELVRPDHGACRFEADGGGRLVAGSRCHRRDADLDRRSVKEAPGPVACFQQSFDLGPQGFVRTTVLVQERPTLFDGAQLHGLQEQVVRSWIPGRHGMNPVNKVCPHFSVREMTAACARKKRSGPTISTVGGIARPGPTPRGGPRHRG